MTTNDVTGARRDTGAPEADQDLVQDQNVRSPQASDDQQTMHQLAATLGELRRPRPGFQAELEASLVGRLAAAREPWWRRAIRSVQPAAGRVPMTRRAMLGAAAAGALSLFAISLAVPITGQSPEVSAREILERVQAASDNPILAGIKSFHLVAASTNNRRGGTSATVTTEQWFVAPDKMKTETRTKQPDGSVALSGFVHDGSNLRHYASGNARDTMVVGIFVAPVGAPFGKEPSPDVPVSGPPGLAVPAQRVDVPVPPAPPRGPAQPSGAIVVKPADGKPEGVEDQVTRIERSVGAGPASGKPEAGDVLVVGGQRNTSPNGQQVEEHAAVVTFNCPEPQRKGEATIAGRPVFVVEADMSQCVPEGAPDELRGRHVRWVDQKTFLPLKMEMYDRQGTLIDRYEVTSIEYDVSVPDSTFSQLPPGTTVHEPRLLPPPDVVRPGVLPVSPPAPARP